MIRASRRFRRLARTDESALVGRVWRLGHMFGPDRDIAVAVKEIHEKLQRRAARRA